MLKQKKLKSFFFSTFDPQVLGTFRIIFGLFIVIVFVALLPNWEKYYGPLGLRPAPTGLSQYSLFLLLESWIPIQSFWWIGFFSALSFSFGWMTKVSNLILFAIYSSMNLSNPMMINGEDLVIRLFLFYGLFSPLGARFSIDQLLNPERYSRLYLIWPLRLMQLNLVLIYVFSLPLKLLADPSWLNGEAIYWVMMTSSWHRWPSQSLFYNTFISKLITYGAIIAEGSFPILIWFQSLRLPILIYITFFHICLGICLKNVSFFSFSMVCAFSLFLPIDGRLKLIQKSPSSATNS